MVNYHRLAKFALILAVLVIMLGAYTRLTDAGLGCPDWPGCYGRMVLPQSGPKLVDAQHTYPDQPIVAHKAWTEMVHRYVAGTLGLLIIILAIWAVINYRRGLPQPMVTPFLLVGMLIFQAILGMWTVTLKLLPLVVTGHLLGGMAIAALLSWLTAATAPRLSSRDLIAGSTMTGTVPNSLDPAIKSRDDVVNIMKLVLILGLIILIVQLFLGAWTSTNYAALACGTDFPSCHTTLWPQMDWVKAFNIFSPIGPNYEGGRLEMMARVTIQMMHRYWAFVTFIYLLLSCLFLLFSKFDARLRPWVIWLLILLGLQIALGIINVVKLLPLAVAVAHNGVAVLLLVTLVFLIQRFRVIYATSVA